MKDRLKTIQEKLTEYQNKYPQFFSFYPSEEHPTPEEYKEIEEVLSHQDFLEDLNHKLRVIASNERNLGEINWELDRQMTEIKALYQELEKLRKEMLAENK